MAASRTTVTMGRRQSTALLVVVVALMTATGCQRKLFPSDQPRTQFQTYDRMRQQDTQTEETDVFGRPQPALRARLTPPS